MAPKPENALKGHWRLGKQPRDINVIERLKTVSFNGAANAFFEFRRRMNVRDIHCAFPEGDLVVLPQCRGEVRANIALPGVRQ